MPASIYGPDPFEQSRSTIDSIVDVFSKQNLAKQKISASSKPKKSKSEGPFQNALALQYMSQNPESNILSTPGMEDMNALYQKKQASRQMPQANPYDPTVYLTQGGFSSRAATKEESVLRIMDEAEQLGAEGKKLPLHKQRYLDKYYGAEKGKKDIDAKGYEKARALAEDLAKRAKTKAGIESGMIDQEEGINLKNVFVTNEDINQFLPKAMQALFPKAIEKLQASESTADPKVSPRITTNKEKAVKDFTLSSLEAGMKAGLPDKKEPEYKVGQIIETKRGNVRIVGFDEDGEPLIEKVQ